MRLLAEDVSINASTAAVPQVYPVRTSWSDQSVKIREGILKIPWFNSLAILYQVLYNGKVPWFYIFAYLPLYMFLILFTGKAFLWHARK